MPGRWIAWAILAGSWMTAPALSADERGGPRVTWSVPVTHVSPQHVPATSPLPPVAAVPGQQEPTQPAPRPGERGALEPGNHFDPRQLEHFLRQPGFTSAPPCDEAAAPLRPRFFAIHQDCQSTSPRLPAAQSVLPEGGDAAGAGVALGPVRPSAAGPTGTMFLWSMNPAGSEGDAPSRGARPTSAGVVLTRPPGDYSLDWVGVAVSASIH
jgi:hypothetical protein